jgi:methyltransferase family protein
VVRVWYRHFLKGVHAALAPPTYFEIGVNRGGTLALSQSNTIAVDPDFELEHEVPATAALFRETSDDYFAREKPLESFGDQPVALALIDGMHLVEYALRDFINVERHTDWSSVIVIDDVLPRRAEHANRNRSTKAWTGDIYKLLGILENHRPDLTCLLVDTKPAGMLVVVAPDPTSRVLSDRYEEIVTQAVVPDPQTIPAELREQRGVLDPRAVLSASFWAVLRKGRESGVSREDGLRRVQRALDRDFGRGGARTLQLLRGRQAGGVWPRRR